MNSSTLIEYCDVTWNPVTGCTKVSTGCDNCFIFGKIAWQKARKIPRYQKTGPVQYHRDVLYDPMKKIKSKRYYICSMGDLFHENIPDKFIQAVFMVVEHCEHHSFMFSTKRTERLVALSELLPWPKNLWVGVSVESAEYAYRIDHLRDVPTENRFVAFEPLVGKFDQVCLDGIRWVIVSGESGPNARPMDSNTVDVILGTAQASNIPFFLKQLDKQSKRDMGRTFNGRVWEEMPYSFEHPQSA